MIGDRKYRLALWFLLGSILIAALGIWRGADLIGIATVIGSIGLHYLWMILGNRGEWNARAKIPGGEAAK